MKDFGLSALGLVLAMTFLLFSFVFDWDIAEKLIALLKSLEAIEVDEVLLALMIFLFFFCADITRAQMGLRRERERWRLYRATIGSVQHVVHNFLNEVTYVKQSAEQIEGFPSELLEIMSRGIESTGDQLKALAQVNDLTAESVAASVGSRLPL